MNRLVALLVLTAAFAPAAVLGALPMVTSIVVVLLVCWILLTSRSPSKGRGGSPMIPIARLVVDPAIEAPVTPIP